MTAHEASRLQGPFGSRPGAQDFGLTQANLDPILLRSIDATKMASALQHHHERERDGRGSHKERYLRVEYLAEAGRQVWRDGPTWLLSTRFAGCTRGTYSGTYKGRARETLARSKVGLTVPKSVRLRPPRSVLEGLSSIGSHRTRFECSFSYWYRPDLLHELLHYLAVVRVIDRSF